MGNIQQSGCNSISERDSQSAANVVETALDRALFPKGIHSTSGCEPSSNAVHEEIGVGEGIQSVRSALSAYRIRSRDTLDELTKRLSIIDSFQHATSERKESRQLGKGGAFVVQCGLSHGAVKIELEIQPSHSGVLGIGSAPIMMQATLHVEGAPIRADAMPISAPGQKYYSKEERLGWFSASPTQWSERSIVESVAGYLLKIVDSAVEAIERLNEGLPESDVRLSFEMELVSRCAHLLNTPALLHAYVIEREKQMLDLEVDSIRKEIEKKDTELRKEFERILEQVRGLRQAVLSDPSLSESVDRFKREFPLEVEKHYRLSKSEITNELQTAFDLFIEHRSRIAVRAQDQSVRIKLFEIANKRVGGLVNIQLLSECAATAAKGFSPHGLISAEQFYQIFDELVAKLHITHYVSDHERRDRLLAASTVAAKCSQLLDPARVGDFLKALKNVRGAAGRLDADQLEQFANVIFSDTTDTDVVDLEVGAAALDLDGVNGIFAVDESGLSLESGHLDSGSGISLCDVDDLTLSYDDDGELFPSSSDEVKPNHE